MGQQHCISDTCRLFVAPSFHPWYLPLSYMISWVPTGLRIFSPGDTPVASALAVGVCGEGGRISRELGERAVGGPSLRIFAFYT